ncbi:hypothetical protein [Streptomyces sp. MNP-20]|uniref:hypothetical protein n=1 Tax=Streptomyces sp. MNP-20 TaxID=2721165 RepID=UPI001C1E3750|nr:hypothetical protein [Streptomyces sp. MNP-20]
MLRTGSPLFDTGLIDPDGLAHGLQALEPGRYEERRDSQLIEAIHLHQAATAFL